MNADTLQPAPQPVAAHPPEPAARPSVSATLAAAPAALNFQPLSSPVTHAESEAYLKQAGIRLGESWLITFFAVWAAIGLLATLLASGSGKGAAAASTGIVWMLAGVGAMSMIYAQAHRDANDAVRAAKFAAANNFSFVAAASVGQQGTLWQWGTERRDVRFMVGTHQNRPFMLGTHVYVTGSGRSRSTHYVSFLRVTLPRELPHLLIDARRDVLNLAEGVDRSQRLSLEGDFNNYFTVYCPDGYQEDVLYFLTPELMQLMIDNDQAYDMEVVGDQLYFYRNGKLRYDDATVRHLFGMLEKTGGEFAENTRLYRDDRSDAPAGGIAPEGMNFKRHITASQVVGMLILLVYLVFQFYLGLHHQ